MSDTRMTHETGPRRVKLTSPKQLPHFITGYAREWSEHYDRRPTIVVVGLWSRDRDALRRAVGGANINLLTSRTLTTMEGRVQGLVVDVLVLVGEVAMDNYHRPMTKRAKANILARLQGPDPVIVTTMDG